MVRPGKEVKTLAVSQSPLARLDERVAVPLERAEAAAEIYQPQISILELRNIITQIRQVVMSARDAQNIKDSDSYKKWLDMQTAVGLANHLEAARVS